MVEIGGPVANGVISMRFVLRVIILLSAGASTALAADGRMTERQWSVDGVTRTALLYVPPLATKAQMPVVFAFHGHGGSAHECCGTLWIPERLAGGPGGVHARPAYS